MLWKLLKLFRDLVWKLRRWWVGDPWEVQATEWDYCFDTTLPLHEIKSRMEREGYILDIIPQFEYIKQVCSGIKYLDSKQYHIRILEGTKDYFEVHAHHEFRWDKEPWKHLKGEECIKYCQAADFLRS
jgi:hypothetical protein